MMTRTNRNFIILLSIVFLFGSAFWVQYIRYAHMPEIPDTIVIGTAADYPPFSFKHDNIIVGFDIDVAVEAVKRLGKEYIIEDVPFELLIPQAMMGKLPIVAAGLSQTDQRVQQVYFTKPHMINNQLVVLTDIHHPVLKNLDDLANKQIVVNKGYTADDYMSKLNNLAIDRIPTIADAVKALQSEKVDALVTEAQTVPLIFEKYGQDFNLFVIPESQEAISLAISKQYPQLAQKLDVILDGMQQDGTLDQLQKKWNIQ